MKKFVEFKESMLDRLYDNSDGDDLFRIKTQGNDILHVELQWEQGHGNNYYFYSPRFDVKIYPDEVKEIEQESEETLEELLEKVYTKMKMESKPLPENFGKILSENIQDLF